MTKSDVRGDINECRLRRRLWLPPYCGQLSDRCVTMRGTLQNGHSGLSSSPRCLCVMKCSQCAAYRERRCHVCFCKTLITTERLDTSDFIGALCLPHLLPPATGPASSIGQQKGCRVMKNLKGFGSRKAFWLWLWPQVKRPEASGSSSGQNVPAPAAWLWLRIFFTLIHSSPLNSTHCRENPVH